MPRGGLLRKIGGAIGGAAGGIGAGAQAIGTGLGRLGGRAYDVAESARIPGVSRALLGEEGQERRFERFVPEQQEALSQILQQALGQYQNLSTDFAPIAERARTQFQEQTIPSLAERFTGLGGQRSSAFGQQVGQAGADLESQLAAMESQFGLEQGKLAQIFLALGLTPQFESTYFPRKPGMLESGAQSTLANLPSLATLL